MKTTTYFGAVTLAFMLGTAIGTGCSIADPADETALETGSKRVPRSLG